MLESYAELRGKHALSVINLGCTEEKSNRKAGLSQWAREGLAVLIFGRKSDLIDDVDYVGHPSPVSRYFWKPGYFRQPLDLRAVNVGVSS
ncbi:hypothetical protein VNO78_01845 [Psophocarpus tetragonolobus]|uniref:Uncharacterized protein n=1 Tax=Psophocarpus tetragonolobus TaxID=3891 RepID=A0AAN9SY95_PSOTE